MVQIINIPPVQLCGSASAATAKVAAKLAPHTAGLLRALAMLLACQLLYRVLRQEQIQQLDLWNEGQGSWAYQPHEAS